MNASIKTYKFAEFILNSAKRMLFRENEEIKLRDKDFDVLLYLIENAPKTCSHNEIIQTVWSGTSVENNSVEKAIVNIRNTLGDDAKNPQFIKTIRSKGYLFVADVREVEETLSKEQDFDTKKIQKIENSQRLQSKLPKLKLIAGLCVSIFVFGVFIWWQFGGILTQYNSTAIFTDDFSSNLIDSNRWTIKGKTVKVESGIAKLVVEETDNGGILQSNYFSFDPNKTLTVKSRIKVAYSQNLKDKFYFCGYFVLVAKTSSSDEEEKDKELQQNFFGISYANYDYESKFPDGNTKEQKTEGFFLVRNGGLPHRTSDYALGKISPRIAPIWNKWFEQKIVYEPFSGRTSYFIDGELKGEFNADKFSTDLQENELRLEINPQGWWLYHSIDLDYIEVTQ